jgi:ketosteroid isomerase-like protein
MWNSLIVGNFVLIACITSASSAPGGCRTCLHERQAIEANNTAFVETVLRHGSVHRFYTPTAVVLPDHGPMLTGRDAITHYWLEGGQAIKSFKLTTADVMLLAPAVAREIGTYSLATTEGRSVGNYLVVWRRDGGEWQIENDVWNSDN